MLALLSLRPLNTLGMVRRHHDLLYAKISSIIRWIATALWAFSRCSFSRCAIRSSQAVSRFPHDQPRFFCAAISQVGAILAFPVTVWAAFSLRASSASRSRRMSIPYLNLPRGIPYAVSTMVHYTVLVLGFFLALSAMGGI